MKIFELFHIQTVQSVCLSHLQLAVVLSSYSMSCFHTHQPWKKVQINPSMSVAANMCTHRYTVHTSTASLCYLSFAFRNCTN